MSLELSSAGKFVWEFINSAGLSVIPLESCFSSLSILSLPTKLFLTAVSYDEFLILFCPSTSPSAVFSEGLFSSLIFLLLIPKFLSMSLLSLSPAFSSNEDLSDNSSVFYDSSNLSFGWFNEDSSG